MQTKDFITIVSKKMCRVLQILVNETSTGGTISYDVGAIVVRVVKYKRSRNSG